MHLTASDTGPAINSKIHKLQDSEGSRDGALWSLWIFDFTPAAEMHRLH
jgi:hypothetical protein